MPANEFEKKVQGAMDEFSVRPSGEVWQKVEQRIRSKERKTRIIFVILFSVIGVALGGYGIYYFSAGQNTPTEIVNTKIQAPDRTKPKDQSTNPTSDTKVREQVYAHEQKSGNSKNDKSSVLSKHQKTDNTETKTLVNRVNNRTRITKEESRISKSVATTSQEITTNPPGALPTSRPIKSQTRDQKDTASMEGNDFATTRQNSIDSNQNITATIGETATKESVTDTASRMNSMDKPAPVSVTKSQVKKPVFEKKLKWGVHFSTGSSTIAGSLFSFKNPYNSGNRLLNGPSNSTGGTSQYAPVENRAGGAFIAGATIRKDISKRSSVSVGVDYMFFSDKVKTGTRQNYPLQSGSAFSIASFYAGVPQNDFTDKFHFIAIPVFYDWRITRNQNHFLSLDAGASIAMLVSTNALTYDSTAGGIYYHNKDLFNKTHLYVSSGMSYHFAAGKAVEFTLGPLFSFDVSKIIKSDVDKRKYFLYGGFDARLFLEKKKRK